MAFGAASAFVLPGPRWAAAALPCPRRCLRLLLLPRPSHRRCPFAFAFLQLAAAGSTAMDNGAVYNETTEPQAKPPRSPFGCALRHVRGWRQPIKALQAVSPSLSSSLARPGAAGAAGGASGRSGARAAVAAHRRGHRWPSDSPTDRRTDWLTDRPLARAPWPGTCRVFRGESTP